MKYFYLIAAMCCTLVAQAQTQNEFELRTLTFEEEEWSSFIDKKQYGGKLLYGEDGMGGDLTSESYKWIDAKTLLSSGLSGGWGMWCYMSGGHAVSNYGSKNFTEYGNFNNQLTVYNSEGSDEISNSGNGHNGSNNFAMHYGYHDDTSWSAKLEELPALTFTDGVARVIDHMWVNNNCYAISCYLEGNGLTAKIGPDDWVKIVAIGYIGTTETGKTAEIYLCNGPDNIVTEWTKFDLSVLGEVTKVAFNVTGSSDNGYGFSQPAYFAYDDVAVRFPKSSGIENITVNEEADDVYYDLMGRRVNNPTKGIYIHNGKKVYIR